MTTYHRLLARQIDETFGTTAAVPDGWRPFLDAIDAAYHAFDADRDAVAQSTDRRKIVLETEARFHTLVQHAADLISILNESGVIRYQSPTAERVLGRRGDTLTGTSWADIVHPDDAARARRLLTEARGTPGVPVTGEMRVRHADGSWLTLEVIAKSLVDQPSIGGILLTSRDISERKQLEAKLVHQAYHDPLTGLPNRALFMERLGRAAANPANSVAVIFLDIDDFKLINDTLGHKAGDSLLMAVSERLLSCVRPEDTVARLGGDEFTILLEQIADRDEAMGVVERVQARLRLPTFLNGREVFVASSIGIASNDGTLDAEELLRNADVAMYQAKRNGKAGFAVFNDTMNARAWKRLELEADLRRAIDRSEFRVYYQPVVRLNSEEVIEVEALVRWQHPERGFISPADFIPIAEETGLIVPIGWWVLQEACRTVSEWQAARPNSPPITLAVNLSAKQVQHATLVTDLAETLRETGLSHGSLRLEITESVMMRDEAVTIDMLNALKSLDIQLAIDDFGTGYSSLAYLQRFPLDVLKVDRSFVSELGKSTESMAIVRAIIGLGKALNLEVTGEGIETTDQLEHLRALGADRGQGYLFSPPLSQTDITRLLPPPRIHVLTA